jgi:hypothetical protein
MVFMHSGKVFTGIGGRLIQALKYAANGTENT